jgi:hypothetical protein
MVLTRSAARKSQTTVTVPVSRLVKTHSHQKPVVIPKKDDFLILKKWMKPNGDGTFSSKQGDVKYEVGKVYSVDPERVRVGLYGFHASTTWHRAITESAWSKHDRFDGSKLWPVEVKVSGKRHDYWGDQRNVASERMEIVKVLDEDERFEALLQSFGGEYKLYRRDDGSFIVCIDMYWGSRQYYVIRDCVFEACLLNDYLASVGSAEFVRSWAKP